MCVEHPWDFFLITCVVKFAIQSLHDKCTIGFILCLHPTNKINNGETHQGNHNQI
jgi:hypothetical protein